MRTEHLLTEEEQSEEFITLVNAPEKRELLFS
jgi:hypothetical protein